MSVRQAVEITCDGCEFTVPDYATATQVRSDLRRQGWLTGQRGSKDYCPDCRLRCPSCGTGRLEWVSDQYRCAKCGDEWTYETIHQREREETR